MLYSIETSQFSLDGGAMFGIIPKTLWEIEAPADEYNRIQMVTRSLLLVSDDRKIIIDTGNGDKWDDKARARYNIDLDDINQNMVLHLLTLQMSFARIYILTMQVVTQPLRTVKLYQPSPTLLTGFIRTIGLWQIPPVKRIGEVTWRRTGRFLPRMA